MTTLHDTILHHIEVYAKSVPHTKLDSPTDREWLAQHLAGNLAMWQQEMEKPLTDALEILAKPTSYENASKAIPVKVRTIAQVALEQFYAKRAGILQ